MQHPPPPRPTHRRSFAIPHMWANTALLVALGLLLATGVGALFAGAPSRAWVVWLHGVGGYVLLLLLLPKARIIANAYRRRQRLSLARLAFAAFALLIGATVLTGLLWTFAGPQSLGGYSLMVVHGTLAVGAGALMLWHVVAKRFILRQGPARDRRALLQGVATALAGAALWRGSEPLQRVVGSAPRRFTGSFEMGSFSPTFPEVSWLFDFPAPIDPAGWRLVVVGAVAQPLTLTYAELLALAGESTTATIDCTGGWYSTQVWGGVPLARLLELARPAPTAQSITVAAPSGYARRFSLAVAQGALLATHVAGEPLRHGHGAPLRLVVPGRRGYDWVKWATVIRVNETSHLWQPPLPVQ